LNKRRISPAALATLIVVAIVILLVSSTGYYTDFLWFSQLGFAKVFSTKLLASIGLFVVGFVGMALPTWISISLAFRNRPIYAQFSTAQIPGLAAYRDLLTQIRRLITVVVPIAVSYTHLRAHETG
jgi:uncharacterized membrane protein (UPF0182 family)